VWFEVLLFPGMFFCILLAFFYEWVLRRVVGRVQARYGPLYTGFKGVAQPIADFLKLLSKEDLAHKGVDRFLFEVLPLVSVILPLFALLFIPIAASPVLSVEYDLLLLFFLITSMCTVLCLAGYCSRNRFSLVGGMRTVLLMIAFDIPLFLALIGPALEVGSVSIADISGKWFLLTQPIGFAVFLLCSLAELELLPFDLPEAESEIVGGWLTEFSGKKLAFFRLSKDLFFLLMAGVGTTLFLGGPGALGMVGFVLKTTCLAVLLSFLASLFPRFTIEQAVEGAWKYLVPLALVQVLFVRLRV
jgi:NADH-quinone oxidoreductase subunit H